MRAGHKPLLAPSARTEARSQAGAGAGHFSVESNGVSIDYDGDGARYARDLVASLDGRATVAELAARLGMDTEAALALLRPLHDESLLLDAAIVDHEPASAGEFLEAFRHECRFWSRHLFAQRFWTELRAGTAAPTTVLGWGIEFYHYVRHAETYMAAGVAYCAESWQARQWVSKHFVEEAGHGAIFLEGLVGAGIERARIERAPPLPATRALMNVLTESAMEGALPYTACFGLTQPETTPPTEAEQERFYEGLRAHYPAAASLFAAFLRHARIDAALGHEQIALERILAMRGGVDRSSRAAIIRSVRRLAEHFVVFFEQIVDAYASPTGQFPRRAPGLGELFSR